MTRVLGIIAVLSVVGPASAGIVVFRDLPTALATPPNVSFHNATGPVIADDFVPTVGGVVSTITWWGSAAQSNSWELVLQNNNSGQPALTPAGNNITGGVKALGVTAVGVPYAPLPGVFQFSADLSGLGFSVAAGTDYWITIANLSSGWNWAEALAGPTIGSENFNGHSSTGGICLDGGPHCGPWTDIHTDFAAQVEVVPEPTSLPITSMALLSLAAVRIMRDRRQAA
jgi:hypothetical protein